MPRMLLFVSLLSGLLLSSNALATNTNARIALHLAPAAGNGCDLAQNPPACSGIVTNGSLSPSHYYAYAIVTDGDPMAGIAGVEFGISYDGAPGSGVDIASWNLCGTLDFFVPEWPASGTGIIVTWDNVNHCQRFEPGGPGTGVVAVAGYLYVSSYSPDDLSIIPWPAEGVAKVASCQAAESTLSPGSLGSVRFSASGGEFGFNPCSGSPPAPATCHVTGPASLPETTTGAVYSVTTNAPGPTYLWSVTGSAAIVGPTTGPGVVVNAGPPGTFRVSVFIHDSNNSVTECGLDVNVTSGFGCDIPCGPDNMDPQEIATFQAPPQYSCAWSSSGGTLLGPTNQPTVQVQAVQPGSFNLRVTMTYNGIQSRLTKTVVVGPLPPEPPDSQKQAKILVHLRSPVSKNACTDPSSTPTCDAVVTSGGLYPQTYYAFVLVAGGYTSGSPSSGVAGLQFGIQYDGAPGAGVDIYGWTLCATMEFPSGGWPAAGTGNLVTWDRINKCQHLEPGGAHTGVVAAAGYFYMAAYSPDRLAITPRPVDGEAKVANCNAAEAVLVGPGITRVPYPLGFAEFSAAGNTGYNPCTAAIPIHPTTWSGIKTLFE